MTTHKRIAELEAKLQALGRARDQALDVVYQAALKAASICQLIGDEKGSLFEDLDAIEQALTNCKRLNTAIEALRQIPSWASILLATDSPPPRYIVRITEGDVGGDTILVAGDDDLVVALEQAHAQYLLFNREYAHKLKGIAWGEKRAKEIIDSAGSEGHDDE